ncbi:hypothetical protein KIN20_025379 [Parelaphostrongylus tenuis]|uniref:Uncharacterized protein n=1 Tax=Parelaphostrongylus tenuis TaxID=148309 RepID=A0AAD5MV48_PARTN|nr:hypothetical protein KIN20_025379 [Parelaphostrongylus tenuis]
MHPDDPVLHMLYPPREFNMMKWLGSRAGHGGENDLKDFGVIKYMDRKYQRIAADELHKKGTKTAHVVKIKSKRVLLSRNVYRTVKGFNETEGFKKRPRKCRRTTPTILDNIQKIAAEFNKLRGMRKMAREV